MNTKKNSENHSSEDGDVKKQPHSAKKSYM